MIDHVSLRVRDYARSKEFFTKALMPLGYELIMEFGTSGGFGPKGKPEFWVSQKLGARSTHIAFASPDRKTVDAFYAAAMAAGGRDNGKPGIRMHYHANYYAAFVHDPDGNNIEAVCHTAE
ncbi:MAG: VOC family protein [Candidatus Komeilibacteria bacterium]|nr:VOC family protein [Candidatus Komeilibacteria bacterium]